MLRESITNEVWEKIAPLLPAPKGRHGNDDRRFLEAVYWVLRTGAPWRGLHSEFGSWKTVYNRYSRWGKKGHPEKILNFF